VVGAGVGAGVDAIVALLLLTLTFGTADMGLFMYKYVQAANCTREAARRAAVRKDPDNIPYCLDASLRPTVTYADAGKAAGTDVGKGRGSSRRIAENNSGVVSPSNGRPPAISDNITPRAQISVRASTGAPRICSGDM